jgi:hypothetical protein
MISDPTPAARHCQQRREKLYDVGILTAEESPSKAANRKYGDMHLLASNDEALVRRRVPVTPESIHCLQRGVLALFVGPWPRIKFVKP